MSIPALIIVDVQTDFCDKNGSLYVNDADTVVPDVEALRDALRTCWGDKLWSYFTMDTHPPNHVSFAVNNPGSTLFKDFKLPGGTNQMMWPEHCIVGSPGWQLYPPLTMGVGSVMIMKGLKTHVDSYSGFGSVDGVSEMTPLLKSLQAVGITHVVVCGVAFDYCVAATAKDAVKHGFKTCVARQATRGVANDSSAKELALMEQAGVKILDTVQDAVAFTQTTP